MSIPAERGATVVRGVVRGHLALTYRDRPRSMQAVLAASRGRANRALARHGNRGVTSAEHGVTGECSPARLRHEGLPDPGLGERVAAAGRLASHAVVAGEELRDFTRPGPGHFEVPACRILRSRPLLGNDSGKVPRGALRDEYAPESAL
jgi:hypothetical protein